MPGAAETPFFDRAGMKDTKRGSEDKDDPRDVAKAGFNVMIRGEGDVVTGLKNKVRSSVANVTPSELLAKRHRSEAEPGTAR